MTIGPQVAVLRPWEPVSRLCDRILADLPTFARGAALRVREDLEEYASLSLDEHVAGVAAQLRRRLLAIAQRRSLDSDDLQRATQLAQRRARQGIPVDVLIGAYHIGDQEIWRALSEHPEISAPYLSEIGSLMLESLHSVSRVFASAHGDVTRMLQSHRVTLATRFVELLRSEPINVPEAAEISATLGLSADDPYAALIWRQDEPEVVLPTWLRQRMDRELPASVFSYLDSGIVVITQRTSGEALAAFASDYLTEGQVGIGLCRPGVRGAALSIGDAELALVASNDTAPIVDFERRWLDGCLLTQSERIQPVLEQAIITGRDQPHLAETVMAFAAANMSISNAARTLHLHPNTMTYRLERWAKHTGLDARTFDGLSRSRVACMIASGDHADPYGPRRSSRVAVR